MSNKYLVKDVLEAFFESTNGKDYFIGLSTESSISRAMTQELIKAGINSKTVAVLQQDDGWSAEITTGLFYEDIAEIELGGEYKAVTDLTIEEPVEGEDGTVTTTPKTVSGNAIELEAGNFPKSGKLTLHTIAYDPDTNEVKADLYYILYKAQPDGNFTQSFGMGNNPQTLAFSALVPKGKTSYGVFCIVPRVEPAP